MFPFLMHVINDFYIVAPIIGNIISTVILMQASTVTSPNYNMTNTTSTMFQDEFAYCGSRDCNLPPSGNVSNENFAKPPQHLVTSIPIPPLTDLII